jgi:hypothetical protein
MNKNEEPRYTYDEISNLFRDCKNLNDDFKNHVLAYFNGMAQAMYNVTVGRQLLDVDTPDLWEEGYLKVKSLHDQYKTNENRPQ